MLKKKYVVPSSAMVKTESAAILAGSGGDGSEQKIVAGDESDSSSPVLNWGGETKVDEEYDPD